MKKKKKFILLTLILILILSGYIIPITIVNTFPKVTLVTPQLVAVTNDIHILGEVKELQVSQVTTALPIVPSNVFVKVGDSVEIDQTLATVDTTATQKAIISLIDTIIGAGTYLPNINEMLQLFNYYGIDFEYENSQLVSKDFVQNNISSQVKNNLPTTIKSTTNGVITSLDLVKGSMTYPQSIVCTISQTDQMYVEIQINESNINSINEGDKVIFKATATQDEKYTGSITTIYPTASKVYQGTTQKTVIGAYVELDEIYQNLKPGYNIIGVIKENENNQALILPYEAVAQDEYNQEYVYIYDEKRAIKQLVTTGQELPQGVEILSGVNENSLVINNPQDVQTPGNVVIG